ncbi:MAG TPA: 2Fe-2S iron-sulfur cluster-binding protein [Oligoflexus sp.]|uniref:2Fe-2S iron-sulfur cluster-binding protein n=1 Tax=Oligoflexus sp. TaxID=1971216 RepID=UPI002D2D0E65|nr:2Fe-2S iron-sulfur cluster-binding protein [Oligoflexus sp.]HYX35090.1 2Fe-2S iron-sulfur cluster-binding protein [Oligoflexus sp.]
MSYKATILSIDEDIVVVEGQTLLDAALNQGVDYPHSCKSGRCGVCKSRLTSGEVEHLSHLRFTLTEQEKADGFILACRAVPKTNVKAAWLSQEEEPRFRLEGRVIGKSLLTHDTVRLTVELSNSVRFHPGQFVLLRINGLPERSYSMSNRSSGSALEFFVRVIPGGRVSGWIGSELNPGTSVEVEGPFGSSYLRQDHTGPILAVAGGSGMAPIKAIVEAALHYGMKQDIHLYFGVREERDLYLLGHFESLQRQYSNLYFHTVLDRGSERSRHRIGRLDQVIFSDWKVFEGTWQAYVAGPPPLVESMAHRLPDKGIPPDSIFTDPFVFSQGNPL